ncbi:MAG: hypothetical protein WCC15_16240, partial [Candidatus Acidiferrales bacterium]
VAGLRGGARIRIRGGTTGICGCHDGADFEIGDVNDAGSLWSCGWRRGLGLGGRLGRRTTGRITSLLATGHLRQDKLRDEENSEQSEKKFSGAAHDYIL